MEDRLDEVADEYWLERAADGNWLEIVAGGNWLAIVVGGNRLAIVVGVKWLEAATAGGNVAGGVGKPCVKLENDGNVTPSYLLTCEDETLTCEAVAGGGNWLAIVVAGGQPVGANWSAMPTTSP